MATPLLLTGLSAIALFLAFPPAGLTWLACVALIPYLFVITHSSLSRRQRLVCHGLFSVLYMGLTNVWVFELVEFSTALSMGLLFFIYTLYGSLILFGFGLSWTFLSRGLWMLPCFWIVFEWVRSSGPFASVNGVLGYSQAFNPWLNSYAAIGGIYLLSFVVVLCNVLGFVCVNAALKRRFRAAIFSGFFLIVIGVAPSFLSFSESDSDRTFSVSTLQSAHPISRKMNAHQRPGIRQDFLRLSARALENSPDLLVLPETITPDLNLNRAAFLQEIMILSESTAIILGTPRREINAIYNSAAFLFKRNITYYDKIELMPFGEYWPWKRGFKALGLNNIIPGSEFTPGNALVPFKVGPVTIGTAICLETTHPRLSQDYQRLGVDVLVSLVNNAWFKSSSIATRQLQMLVIRSLETGLPIVQSSNWGYASIITHDGQLTSTQHLGQEAILTQTLPLKKRQVPFLWIGNLILVFSLLVWGLSVLREAVLRVKR